MSNRPILLLGLLLPLLGLPEAAAQETTVVLLVRHAEKVTLDPPEADPALSAEGQVRAEALADALLGAGVDAVLTSQWQRTRLTAAPLAARLGLTPEVVSTSGAQAQPEAVAQAIRDRHVGQTVLVVGHSNTLPDIIAALGGPPMPELCESQYDDLFVLMLGGGRPAPALIRVRYGAPSPPPEPACAPQQVPD